MKGGLCPEFFKTFIFFTHSPASSHHSSILSPFGVFLGCVAKNHVLGVRVYKSHSGVEIPHTHFEKVSVQKEADQESPWQS
jgi:hypothetical protein